MKSELMKKIVLLIFLLPFSGIVFAHGGSHAGHGLISAIVHSVTSLDHMGIALISGLVLALLLSLRRSVRANKRRIRS